MKDEELKELTESLQELNTAQKISCISAVMVDMSPGNIIDMLNGLKEMAKKIISAEVASAKRRQENLDREISEAKSAELQLNSVLEKL